MYDSKKDTTDHIEKVNHYISMFCSEMIKHAENHDKSKLEDFEKPYFDKFTPRLSKSKYGTQEYMDMLNDMKTFVEAEVKAAEDGAGKGRQKNKE